MSRPQRLYRLLLNAYPPAFRRRYAHLALADFGSLHDAVAARRGLGGVLRLWSRTIPAVIRDGWRERRAAPGPLPPRGGRTASRSRRWFEQTLQDVRYGARNLLRAPGFALIAILTIAIGMTANATIYGMVYALVFSELPYGDYEDLAIVWTTYPERGVRFNASSIPDWHDIRTRTEAFEDVAFHQGWEVNLTGGEEPIGLTGYRLTSNTFDMLRVEPLHGRTLVPADGEPGAPLVAVLSWRLWQRLGADPAVVGDTLLLNEQEHRVIGVMPEGFEYPQLQFRGDIWTAMQLSAADLTTDRAHRHVVPVGRLAPGYDTDQANVELATIMQTLEADHPNVNQGVSARTIAMRAQLSEQIKPALAVLLVTVGFVLLICCANVANLFLVRGTRRQTEVVIRSSLGASRLRLVRQLLSEALMVALAGGLLGVVGAEVAGTAIVASVPDFVYETSPSVMNTEPDPRVMLLTFVVAALAGIGFGLMPALRASRVDLQSGLRGGAGAVGVRASSGRLHKVLVVGQVAIAVILVAGAGLMVKGFRGLAEADPGFDPDGVLTAELALNGPRYDNASDRREFHRLVRERLRTEPGVLEAGGTTLLPMSFGNNTGPIYTEEEEATERAPLSVGYRAVTPGYLEAMGARLLTGRSIEPGDGPDGDAVAVVNEAMLRHLPEGDPLGQRVRFAGDEHWMTIVGVVASFRHNVMNPEPAPEMFIPYDQSESWRRVFVVLRTDLEDPTAASGALRDAVWSVDPAIPVDDIRPQQEFVDAGLFILRFPTRLMGAFGALALLLAAVGLYGVLAYLVAQRSGEIGIRLALGATSRHVLRLILRNAAVLTGIGLLLGLLVAVPMGALLASLLDGVNAAEPFIYLGVPLLLALVALLAALLPARRALAVDPATSLRAD